ncbi:MAG: hypothetical protein LBD23_08830 [Oscillospiraceae bacterium]|nr:hypothetical protein [Oscillospiraceae bacterium]
MAKTRFYVLLLAVLLILTAIIFPASAAMPEADAPIQDDPAGVRDVTYPVRVGYIEGESFRSFTWGLTGIAMGLERRGIISGFVADELETDATVIWKALANADGGGRIVFVEDMFFNLQTMDDNELARIINSDEIDLIIVMGTVAGIFISEQETKNDFMVFASANPVLSGIVKSETERFKPNSYAYIDPYRHRRQINIAYNVFEFTKLGLVYENSPVAFAFSGIEQAEISADINGFSVARRHVDEAVNDADFERYYIELKEAFKQLIDEGIDALYVTITTIEDHMLPWLLEDIVAAGVLTIAQSGEYHIRNGAVFGVTLDDPVDQGRFIAHVIHQYLDGTPIDQLGQVNEIVPRMYLNYDAARRTGIHLPFRTLISMDRIFRDE